MTYKTSKSAILSFIKSEKVVMESANAKIPSVVSFIIGGSVKGSWWGLPESSKIYNALLSIKNGGEFFTCRLVRGKLTYVTYDVLPFLARLEAELPNGALSKVTEHHELNGRHSVLVEPLSEWISPEVSQLVKEITREFAIQKITEIVPHSRELLLEIKICSN